MTRWLARVPLIVALVVLSVGTGCSSRSIDAAAPVPLSERISVSPLPPLPPSVIDAPVSFAMEPALRALERAVPMQFGNIDERIVNPNNRRQEFAFAATRSPFRVGISGQHLRLESTIEYHGRGWYDPPLAPRISASCGTGDVRPRLRVVISGHLDLANNWRLRTRTSLDTVTPLTQEVRDECRVTFLSIDVTERVIGAVEGILRKQLPQIDRRLAAFDVRTPLERWYNLLNRQIRISDSLWLAFNPGIVHFGGLRANDTALFADIRLFAQPVVYSGPRVDRKRSPLPPLVRAPRRVGDSLRVSAEGRMGYEVATTFIQRALGGKRFSRFGRSVRIDSVQLYGLGDGRVVLALDFKGAVDGRAYLVGTPTIDDERRMLIVPDLDFDLSTSNALASGFHWLTRADVVAELRQRAEVPLADIVDSTRERVEQVMNRELTRGVRLSANLESGRLHDVVALEHQLLVRSTITGSMGLSIDREIPVGRRR